MCIRDRYQRRVRGRSAVSDALRFAASSCPRLATGLLLAPAKHRPEPSHIPLETYQLSSHPSRRSDGLTPAQEHPMLFTTDLKANTIEISNFILGNSPWLQPFSVISQCDDDLSVSLRSDLGSMLVFQSENPNAERALHQFEECNEMFNEVNIVQEIQLAARTTVRLVLQFCPLKGNAHQLQQMIGKTPDLENSGRDEQHKFINVRGRVQFTANNPEHQGSKLSLSFRASVCKSVLRTDVHHLLFENCGLTGKSYVRDFRVINCSEARLRFLLSQRVGHCVLSPSAKDKNDALTMTFMDYHSGLKIDTDQVQTLGGFAQQTIRVSFLPVEMGEFEYEIFVRNLGAIENTAAIEVHADVTPDECLSEGLQITASSGKHEVLHWGEGHIGLPLYETVTLRNISGDSQFVQMSSDRPSEVSFHFDHQHKSMARERTNPNLDIDSTGTKREDRNKRGLRKQPSGDAGGFGRGLGEKRKPRAKELESRDKRKGMGIVRAHSQKSVSDVLQPAEGGEAESEDYEPDGTEERQGVTHQIDELVLLPGKYANLTIRYVPLLNHANEERGEMSARRFRITFRYSDDVIEQQPGHLQGRNFASQSVKCSAKVCKTVVEVTPLEMLLGDCMLGQTRSGTFVVRNKSDMLTEVSVSHDSKVLSLSHDKIVLPANHSKEVTVIFAPTLKKGDYFNREVWFRNMHNKDDTHISHVRASVKNPDKSAIHSLFYKVNPRRVSFGSINMHAPAPHMMRILNVSASPIRIAIASALPDELEVFVPKSVLQEDAELTPHSKGVVSSGLLSSRNMTRKKQMLIEMVENRKDPDLIAKHISQDDISTSGYGSGDESQVSDQPHRPGAHRQRSFDELEEQANSPRSIELSELVEFVRAPMKWFFSNHESEVQYIREVIQHRKTLEDILHSSMFVTLQSPVWILPGAEVEVLLVLTPKHTPITITSDQLHRAGQLQLFQTSVTVKLLEYDHNLIPGGDKENQEESTQSILVESKICSSVIDLVQRSINFGAVHVNDRREANISIGNLSDVPLMFRIIKTGKFASSSLEFPSGTTGVVRAFGSVDVPLIFSPAFDGEFNEAIRIENALAPSFANKKIWVKAQVRPKRTFWLERLQLSCGSVEPNTKSRTTPCRIVLTNTSKQKRTFCIKQNNSTVGTKDINCNVAFWLEHAGVARDVEKTEEEIESLERDLKISIRKQNQEKQKKIEKKLSSLRQQQLWEGGKDDSSKSLVNPILQNKDEEPKDPMLTEPSAQAEGVGSVHPGVPQAESITFTVNANSCQTILMGVRASTSPDTTLPAMSPHEKVHGQLSVNEVRNVDDMRTIEFDVDVIRDGPPNKPGLFFASPTMLPSAVLSPAVPEFSLSPAEAQDPVQQLVLSPEEVELGEVSVASRARASFNVSNPSSKHVVGWRILKTLLGSDSQQVDVLSFKPEEGELEPGDSIMIKVVCGPTTAGRQVHEAIVHSWALSPDTAGTPVDQVIRFSMVAAHKEYLTFPSLHSRVLDVGVLHVDPSSPTTSDDPAPIWLTTDGMHGSKVVPFTVKSMTHRKVLVTASTNLRRQAYVYADKELTKEVDKLELQAYKGRELYFFLHPTSSQRREMTKQLWDGYKDGQCREIIGGIHFEVFSEDGVNVGSTTLKFISVIGCSSLHVEPTRIDICSMVSPGATVEAKMKLCNNSTKIALPFQIETSDSTGKMIVDKPDGVLSGTAEQDGNDSVEITVTVQLSELGLSHEWIVISNLNLPGSLGHKIMVPVSLFIDDGTMLTSTAFTTEILGGSQVSAMDFGVLYLTPGSEPELVSLHMPQEELQLSLSPGSLHDSLLLQPLTDLTGLRLSPCTHTTSAAHAGHATMRSPSQNRIDSIQGFVNCGDPIVVKKDQPSEMVAEFQLSGGTEDLDRSNNYLNEFTKQLVFYSLLLQRVLKVVYVSGSLCVSHAELTSTSIHLGDIGYTSRYQDAPFEFQVCNHSAAPLHYHLQVQDGVVVPQEEMCNVIEPLNSRTVHALVRTSAMHHQHGDTEWTILIHNDKNASNSLEFVVSATVSACVLQYEGLSTASHDQPPEQHSLAHELPSLKLDITSTAGEAAVFEESMLITNMLHKTLDVIIDLRQPDDATATLQLLSSEYAESANLQPLSSSRLEIGATEEVDLNVRVQLGIGGAAALFEHVSRSGEETDQIVLLGELRITPVGHDMEVIPVFANRIMEAARSNSPNVVWAISTSFMHLSIPESPDKPACTDRFEVQNPSDTPLEFEVSLEGALLERPSVQMMVTPSLFTIEPGQSCIVDVQLSRSSWDPLAWTSSDLDTLILVSDTQQKASTRQIAVAIDELQELLDPDELPVSLFEQDPLEADPPSPVHMKASTSMLLSEHRPVVELRGCTPMDSSGQCYELDVGSRSRQAVCDGVQWELTLNLQKDDRLDLRDGTHIRWSIGFADPVDNPWLSLSADGGELGFTDTTSVMLLFQTTYVGVYTTHLILTNHANPEDIKVVKVMMEVASYQPTTEDGQPYFDLVVQTENKMQIDIPFANPGHTYTDYSFLLCNHSDCPLLFFITSDIESQNSPSELCFSLSQNSIRMFKSIEINPESRQRIYLRYIPQLFDPGVARVETITVFVNCRQIKDYRRQLTLQSNICVPWISVQESELWLHCPPVPSEDTEEWPPATQDHTYSCELQVHNPSQVPAVFKIKSAMHFFDVSTDSTELDENLCSKKQGTVPPGKSVTLQVTINKSTLSSCRHLFMRHLFLEERFSLYPSHGLFQTGNCDFHRVAVRLVVSPELVRKVMRLSFFDVGSKEYHASRILETRVIKFVRAFNVFWFNISIGLTPDTTRDSLCDLLQMLDHEPDHEALFVEFSFLLDEIIFYGMKGTASGGQTHLFINHLSHLMFSATLSNCVPFNQILDQILDHEDQLPIPAAITAWIHKLAFAIARLPSALCQSGGTLHQLHSRFVELMQPSQVE
eukprot:TRINITY_DN16506_c0_g2_i1.p1 TRINITY_DN16506_c0_g2~~TRINITY_DN16506_c0_g2_i1.p1  ORF type:complete len:2939 (-),score=572.88 TRINITY_DN16506_c0_g2_i1:155-8971(-)